MASPPSPSARKRPRGTPTFLTPVRPLKRNPIRETATHEELVLPISQLSLSYPTRGLAWSEEECGVLVEFLMLMTDGKDWPIHKQMPFWEHAGQFVQQQLRTTHLRTGRYMYVRWL
jgi:hypothetical protein